MEDCERKGKAQASQDLMSSSFLAFLSSPPFRSMASVSLISISISLLSLELGKLNQDIQLFSFHVYIAREVRE